MTRAIIDRNDPGLGWYPVPHGFLAAATALFLLALVRVSAAADWQEGAGFRFKN